MEYIAHGATIHLGPSRPLAKFISLKKNSQMGILWSGSLVPRPLEVLRGGLGTRLVV